MFIFIKNQKKLFKNFLFLELDSQNNWVENLPNTSVETKNLIKEVEKNLSPKAKEILAKMIPSNSIDNDTENWWSWKIEKTSSLWTENQVKILLENTLNTDKKILEFFSGFPEFSWISNIADLNKKIKEFWNKKIIKLLESYTDLENDYTLANLLQDWPEKAIKTQIENRQKDLEKSKEIEEQKQKLDEKIMKNFKKNWDFFEYDIKWKKIKIPEQALYSISSKISEEIIWKNIWNINLYFSNKWGFSWIWTNISLSDIFWKIDLNKEITDFFKETGTSLGINFDPKNKEIGLGVTLIDGNIALVKIWENTSFDAEGFVTNSWVWAEIWVNHKSWDKVFWVWVWANADFKWSWVILWPYLRVWVDFNEKIEESKQELEEVFSKVKASIRLWENFEENKFLFDWKNVITKEDYNLLKQTFELIEKENKDEKIFDEFIEDFVKENLIKKYEWINFSWANISVINPHIAMISFVASLFAWAKFVWRWEKLVDLDRQSKYITPEKNDFSNKYKLINFLKENFSINIENWALQVPDDWEVLWDINVLKAKKWIIWNIEKIKIEKIIWEDEKSGWMTVSWDEHWETEAKIKYRLVLNDWKEKIQTSEKKWKINFNFEKKEFTDSIILEKFNTAENITEDFKESLKGLDNKIDVKYFRDKPQLENFWVAIVKWDYKNLLTTYSSELENIYSWFKKLLISKKLYVIDYIASLSSKFKRSSEFLENWGSFSKFEKKYKYKELFKEINKNSLNLSNFSNLHNNLVNNLENLNWNFSSEYVDWIIWFTFRSPLRNKPLEWQKNREPIYRWLWDFTKWVSLLTSNWEVVKEKIDNENDLINIVNNLSEAQLDEFKNMYNLDNYKELKNKIIEDIQNWNIKFEAFLAKDIWLDDVVYLQLFKEKEIKKETQKLSVEKVILEETTKETEPENLDLWTNFTLIKEKKKKIEKKELPPKVEPIFPPEDPKKPEKPKPEMEKWEMDLGWEGIKVLFYEDMWWDYNKDKKLKIKNNIQEIFNGWKVDIKLKLNINWKIYEIGNINNFDSLLKNTYNKWNKIHLDEGMKKFSLSYEKIKKPSIEKINNYQIELDKYNNLIKFKNKLIKEFNNFNTKLEEYTKNPSKELYNDLLIQRENYLKEKNNYYLEINKFDKN